MHSFRHILLQLLSTMLFVQVFSVYDTIEDPAQDNELIPASCNYDSIVHNFKPALISATKYRIVEKSIPNYQDQQQHHPLNLQKTGTTFFCTEHPLLTWRINSKDQLADQFSHYKQDLPCDYCAEIIPPPPKPFIHFIYSA